MGYEADNEGCFPNFRRALADVSSHGHGGLILYMTDALQEYLLMENTLKLLPEFMRLTEEEKLPFRVCSRPLKDGERSSRRTT